MRIKELDGIRGIAVTLVVAHHYLSWLRLSGAQYYWFGVDLFFILSGFLITSILLGSKANPPLEYFKAFYARRSFRIFPAYYFVLTIYLAIALMVSSPVPWSFWCQYLFYYTSLFVGQPPELKYAFPLFVNLGLAVLWSLSVEEIFYLIWAPIVRYCSLRAITVVAICTIPCALIFRLILHTPAYPEMFTFYCRADGLALGALLAILNRKRTERAADSLPDKSKNLNTFWLLSAVVAATVCLLTKGDRSSLSFATYGVICLDIFLAASVYQAIVRAGSSFPACRFLRTPLLVEIGKISYGLYLVHYPARALAIKLISTLTLNGWHRPVLVAIVGLLISVGAAYAMWYGFERRLLVLKDKLFPNKSGHPAVSEPVHSHAGLVNGLTQAAEG